MFTKWVLVLDSPPFSLSKKAQTSFSCKKYQETSSYKIFNSIQTEISAQRNLNELPLQDITGLTKAKFPANNSISLSSATQSPITLNIQTSFLKLSNVSRKMASCMFFSAITGLSSLKRIFDSSNYAKVKVLLQKNEIKSKSDACSLKMTKYMRLNHASGCIGTPLSFSDFHCIEMIVSTSLTTAEELSFFSDSLD